jgi:hypothetical protein
VWDAAQLSLYYQVRALRRAVKFVLAAILGRQLGVRLHLTRRNPLPWGPERPVHVPLLRLFTFTGQGLPWLLDGRFKFGPLQPCTSARPKVGATRRVIFRKGRLLGVDTDGFLTNYMVNESNS